MNKRIYKLGDFSGARLKYEILEFKKYIKIVTEGFIIHNNSSTFLIFSVDNQLIRKLKLKNLSNLIKPHSIDDKIQRLLDNSSPYSEDEPYYNYNYNYNYEYKYSFCERNYNILDDYYHEELRNQKRYQKYQSKQINQIVNRYNKK